ncbi:Aldehyde/histidinol dehydrogenase [Cokeromyces recurvatus]|uniref:Aldehyde/histidinol dehydrogenase n=1 Tax=Cokeromyces recurvatus TaxID=90255 RepID=UPI00221ED3B5|nr:Aldehyde/histidinol dehydrogenase [Cokeromyces recurvatus]KAI7898292.1 Aldehyde/histidinol dehydrogenase [Cokeromyces recurvatus]
MSDILHYSSLESIQDHVSHVRQIFLTGKPRDLKWRKLQLQRLYDLVSENEDKLYEALSKDMNKPLNEAMSGDIAPILDECLYFIDHLDQLAQDRKVVPRSSVNKMEKVIIRRDPVGVVLIIGSWNYPIQLSLVPLAGAIAAGNSVILKLSEVAPYTAAVITELFPKYLDTSCYRIVNGGVHETTALLNEKFDHIFYTGNSTVAKIIMTAAAKHLTPVTLELGGKSPAIITPDATNIPLIANRIAFGKLYNCGQICIAVDYVLCPKSKLNEFITCFKQTVKNWYGSNPQKSKDYARIVSDHHVERIKNMLNARKSGDIVFGGEIDKEDRYIAPTLVVDVKENDPILMGDEIFGPILPIITYQDVDETIRIINKREPPLALYIFSNQRKIIEKVLRNTQSGGVCVNDCLMHQAEYSIPFGGVGASGMATNGIRSSCSLSSLQRA